MVRCADDSLYTGIAKDLQARLDQHNAGEGAKYTRARRPVSLVYCEVIEDQGRALRREYELKQFDRAAKLALIAACPLAVKYQIPKGDQHATS